MGPDVINLKTNDDQLKMIDRSAVTLHCGKIRTDSIISIYFVARGADFMIVARFTYVYFQQHCYHDNVMFKPIPYLITGMLHNECTPE